MNEFSLQHGRLGKGLLSAAGGAITFLIIPMVIILGTATLLERIDVGEFLDPVVLENVMLWLMLLGAIITVLSFFNGYYPRGSLSRMTFGLVMALLIGIWVWTATRGGMLEVNIDGIMLTVDFIGLVIILLAVVALRGLYSIVEMYSYRKDWLASLS
ncbi:MAG: hypothetical protein GX307_07850 [Euryarchaeota archaeon]|nr:hypothetical protein [Euryarchaeota archaeon]